jgi:hypothetical protein
MQGLLPLQQVVHIVTTAFQAKWLERENILNFFNHIPYSLVHGERLALLHYRWNNALTKYG